MTVLIERGILYENIFLDLTIHFFLVIVKAIKRKDYLSAFDGGVLASGSHTVIGTVLVRTSNELTASQQKDLEAKIIAALTYLPEHDDKIPENTVPDSEQTTTDSEDTTTEETTTETNTEAPTTSNKTPENSKPTNRNQEAVAEAERQASIWFPIDRHFIKYILVNPSLAEGFEAFTESEATYAIQNANINWKEHALYNALELIEANPDFDFSKQDMYAFVEDSGGYCTCAGYTEEELQYAVENCGINWEEETTVDDNNRDNDAIETARWMAYYDYQATPREIQTRLISEEGFSEEDAQYCVSQVDNSLLEGSQYNWIERVEYYVTYRIDRNYIEYTWCNSCSKELYGIQTTCPLCNGGWVTSGQLAFGLTKDEVISVLRQEGFKDSDITEGLKAFDDSYYYNEDIYVKP